MLRTLCPYPLALVVVWCGTCWEAVDVDVVLMLWVSVSGVAGSRHDHRRRRLAGVLVVVACGSSVSSGKRGVGEVEPHYCGLTSLTHLTGLPIPGSPLCLLLPTQTCPHPSNEGRGAVCLDFGGWP